ncbi:MAG: gamma-glutamyltransferase [Pseudohongiellaceae bacterium]
MRQFFILLFISVFSLQTLANTVSGHNGAVASRSEIASQVGVDIMQRGGNAIDAAVAVGFALAVTYPSAGNIGGGSFFVIHTADGEAITLDAREKAPLSAHEDMFLDEQGNLDRRLSMASLLASGVPGTVAGLLEALDRHGTMTRAEVIAPAIRLAREGFALNEDLAGQFAGVLRSMQAYPASMAVFTNDGDPYQAGDVWAQPALADTLERISEQGRDGFYRGHTADLLVAEMERNGGMISHRDLQEYDVQWRQPIKGSYRDYTIWSMPPSSSGGILLVQMLNMLEPFHVGAMGPGSAPTVHLMVEAQRRAYADRARHLGDTDYYPVPMEQLISKDYARTRFDSFDSDAATPSETIAPGSWPGESTQTTHYSVMDGSGNAVSVTTTLNSGYGNKIVVPGAGFLLNNEMDDFSAKPNVPNSYGLIGGEANKVEPGKRMLSSMTPTIVTRNETPILVTGSPGGSTIINTVFQVVVNVIDHQMSLADAVASPRFHHQWQPDAVRFEEGAFAPGVKERLEAMGHSQLRESGFGMGDANSIYFDGETITATSDPRNAGGAAAY